jgi:hypothetical protein
LHPGIKVARCDIQPTAALDQASIVAQLLEQLGEHLPACADDVAIQRLRQHALADAGGIVTVLAVGGVYDAGLLTPIIEAAMQSPASAAPRVVLLLAPAAAGPDSIAGAAATVSKGDPFEKTDVIHHLQKRWGLDSAESEQMYSSMERMGVTGRPARVYESVKELCGIASARIS